MRKIETVLLSSVRERIPCKFKQKLNSWDTGHGIWNTEKCNWRLYLLGHQIIHFEVFFFEVSAVADEGLIHTVGLVEQESIIRHKRNSLENLLTVLLLFLHYIYAFKYFYIHGG